MAERITREVVDDIDGTPIDSGKRSVNFALDGVNYEIDLGNDNHQALRDLLADYIQAGRKVNPYKVAKVTAPAGSLGIVKDKRAKREREARVQAIREWAAQQIPPIDLADRGRIPLHVEDLYDQLTGGGQTNGSVPSVPAFSG